MQWPLKVEVLLFSETLHFFFKFGLTDILKKSTNSEHMSFSKLNSQLDLNFLKIYTPHVTIVLLMLCI